MTNLINLPPFTEDGDVYVVVETPRGSRAKFAYDPKLKTFTLSKSLLTGLTYPHDWGFVPSTTGPDGDPIDVAVFWDVATFPGVVIPCRALGLVKVEQSATEGSSGRRRNDRILAIPVEGRRQQDLRSVRDLSDRIRQELELFFVTAAALEGKDPKILGWDGPEAALSLLRSSQT